MIVGADQLEPLAGAILRPCMKHSDNRGPHKAEAWRPAPPGARMCECGLRPSLMGRYVGRHVNRAITRSSSRQLTDGHVPVPCMDRR
jgi:hypothetical protein